MDGQLSFAWMLDTKNQQTLGRFENSRQFQKVFVPWFHPEFGDKLSLVGLSLVIFGSS